jgi:D-alanine-D-alanine ligase
VKPNAEGSTVGCTLVEDASLLKAAIGKALKYDDDVLIEQYISGTEITVGVLEDADGKITCLPPVEIVPKGEFYDYESKYAEGGSEHVIPARIGDNLTSLALNYAARCHALLHCRGMSRTDMIASASGLYVLEVNTIPGMTPTSLLPQAAASVGISFSELLDRIINSAIGRKGEVSGRPEDAIKQ